MTPPSIPGAPKAPTLGTRRWWAPPAGCQASTPRACDPTEQEQVLASRVERQTAIGHFRIPQIPEIAAKAVALLAKPDAETNEVSKLILEDQQLAADVVAFSNSSLFAGATKTTNIPQAINRVGFRRTRSLIFAASLRAMIYSGCEVGRAEKLWRHSVGCGAIAAKLAQNLRYSTDDAYLAGLFHDVGKTVVLSVLDLIAVRSQQLPLRSTFVEYVLALHHERVGAEVARHWTLPEHVQDAIRGHTESEAPMTTGQAIVCLANNACRRLEIGESDDGRAIAGPSVLRALNAEEADLAQILEGVLEVVQHA